MLKHVILFIIICCPLPDKPALRTNVKTPTIQHRLALRKAYGLFDLLYREGLSARVREIVRAVPELSEALPEPFDPDEAAADHQHLFGFNVFPYASVFLDPDGLLGGPVAEAVGLHFRTAGFDIDLNQEGADHVGHTLAFLGFLAAAEADAWEDNRPDEAARMQAHARRFIDAHLLPWLPAFVEALQRQQVPFYPHLAGLTEALVLDHRALLGSTVEAVHALAPPPALLDDEKTGLKDIAAYLATPPWSGFFLSRDDIGRLGRAENLPRGFGDRRLMLGNLLRAAAEYDRIEPLLAHLLSLTEAARAHYHALATSDLPIAKTVAAMWLERLDTTQQLIARIREGVEG